MTAHRNPIREKLDHPVIDSDGHLREFMPVVHDYVTAIAGRDMRRAIEEAENRTPRNRLWYGMTEQERRDWRTIRPSFWGTPLRNGGLDHATALFPDLMYKRLDEIGIDFAVLFPSRGVVAQTFDDAEMRQTFCRALNTYYSEIWGTYQDRMTPVATIPMHTPAEAIAEITHAVTVLGFKAVMLPSWIKRPLEGIARDHPELGRHAWWADTFGIDSAYDYDPVWRCCVELGVMPSFHGPGEGMPFRNSISNIVNNHVGHFASTADAVCKSLFLGGVPKRFPTLRFLFLEGGVGWARSLLADLASHWEKRSLKGLAANTDPRLYDSDLFMRLYDEFGGKLRRDISAEQMAKFWAGNPQDPTDSFAGLEIETRGDLIARFTEAFYFGCEGDDPVMASAFDSLRNPGQVRLNAVYGSDIGHWDVVEMNEVLEELYETIEHGLITPADLRDFAFTNPARLWRAANPAFFEGTSVAEAVAKLP